MRYDTPVFFQSVQPGKLDTATHNYGEDTIIEKKRYASVTETGVQRLQLIYGTIKQGSLTIRLQKPYEAPFDRVRVGDKSYRVDLSRGRCFIVSEVQ